MLPTRPHHRRLFARQHASPARPSGACKRRGLRSAGFVALVLVPIAALAGVLVIDTPTTTPITLVAGNTLTVTGTGSITIPAGSFADAITTTGNAAITIEAGGAVTGGDSGVRFRAQGSLTNDGIIEGPRIGVANSNGAGTLIINRGTIRGSQFAVAIRGGSITNEPGGLLAGFTQITGSTGQVINGGNAGSVFFFSGGAMINQAGATASSLRFSGGSLGSARVDNAGTLGRIDILSGGMVTNRALGRINGSIDARSTTIVDNAGTVQSGISYNGGATLINRAGARVVLGVSGVGGNAHTIENSGTIGGGVDFAGGANVTNDGAIGGTIRLRNTRSTVINRGSIGGVVTFTNATQQIAHRLEIEPGSTIGGNVAMTTHPAARIVLGGAGSERLSTAIAGASISHAGVLGKQGTSTWTIDRPLGHAQGTEVVEGILRIEHDTGLGTGAVDVTGSQTAQPVLEIAQDVRVDNAIALANATLAGNGTVAAPISFANPLALASLAPGSLTNGLPIGRLSLGDTTVAEGGRYIWQIDDFTGTEGESWDTATVESLDFSGPALASTALGGAFIVEIHNLADNPDLGFDTDLAYEFVLFRSATPITGFGPGPNGARVRISMFTEPFNGGWSVELRNADTELVLVFTPQVNLSVDVSVTKTDGLANAVPGQPLTYTIVVANAGPSNDPTVRIVDTLPIDLGCSWSSVATNGATGSAGTGTGDIDETVSMPASSSLTYTVDCTVANGASGTLSNTVTATASRTDTDPANNAATDETTLLALDLGDAPGLLEGTPGGYPTLLADDGARHGDIGPFLGSLRDSEADGQPSPTATGDDLAGVDDEDGVVFLDDLVACAATRVEVTASAAAQLDVWVDFNRDGDWDDASERVFVSQAVVVGANTLTLFVPCDAGPAGSTFARFRLSSFGELAVTGLALDGEVEDHVVTLLTFDFGDAPDTVGGGQYSTLLANDGARHRRSDLLLGTEWDAELDGQPDANALGDDQAGVDDEDAGDLSTVELVAGETVTLAIMVTGDGETTGFLNVWIDLGRDGVFDLPGDQIATDFEVAPVDGSQLVPITFTVPADVTSGTYFSRIRLSSAQGLLPTGEAPDGEVEDHEVTLIARPTVSVADASVVEGTGGTTSLSFTLTRSHNLSTATVHLRTVDGTALAPSDYASITDQAVDFAAGGALTATVEVSVVTDAVVELDENLVVELFDPVAIDIVSGTAFGAIANDDAATITILDVEALEGDSGSTDFAFEIRLDTAVDVGVTLEASTADGSATVGDGDYAAVDGAPIAFVGQAGETQTVSVTVFGDPTVEPDELFSVVLGNVQAANRDVSFAGGGATVDATGTILNDDATLVIDDVEMAEGNSGVTVFTFTVSLEGVLETGFEIDYATTDDTASVAEGDYQAATGTLSFSGTSGAGFRGTAGEARTIEIMVLGDTDAETDEIFFVDLGTPFGAGAVPNVVDGRGLGTIVDDDDLEPPTVTNVTSIAGSVGACTSLQPQAVSQIAVTVEDDQTAIVGGTLAEDYLLVTTGPDGDFATASCTMGVAGDDLAIPFLDIAPAAQATSLTATLTVADANGLVPGLYRLLVCDTITDSVGKALDGDQDGAAGGDFVVPFFRADPGNRFTNGHFDDCPASLEPWIVVTTPPDVVTTGVAGIDDEAGSPLSASARMISAASSIAALAQCVPTTSGAPNNLRARVRVATPDGGQTLSPALVQARCTFFENATCAGAGNSSAVSVLVLDPSPVWTTLAASFDSPAAARSALCDVATAPATSAVEQDVYFDALFFSTGNIGPIFADGFESGDTSAWSETVP